MKQDVQNSGEVLVVEDTPASLKLLTDLLKAEGYAVRQAPDGELALWSAQSRPPELILLDIRMPGIDGYEVCRRLKTNPRLAPIPVIFLSAQHDTDDKVRGFAAGAVDFIGKPYQAEEVLARAHVHITLARTQAALARTNGELSATLDKLRTARDEVLRAERLAALGALVNGVAHELNTPIGNCVLTASTLAGHARSFGERIEQGVRKSELAQFVAETSVAADLLMRNLDKSAAIVTSFKQVAADQASAERRRFDLGQLARDMSITIAPLLRERSVRLELDIPDGLMLDNYPGPLCQVYNQIVSNALQHGYGPHDAGCIRVSASLEGEQVRMRFCDDGRGIAPEHVEKVFDPFFTTRMGQGSGGLGLHIVHNLVNNVMGGHIGVFSAPGATCFELWLPLTVPQIGPAQLSLN
ncbi:sensor histidine kinase [Massilia sp. TS11]|uniref:sensor histidine kinase n=1 Tax=Massilia sp. TS11 TaxID=2908003 RepID=UPI001EDC7324|nr:hybrid sensor histidine kinase/response regulator [Massilia sp. TS11]MCG2584482.1 hybrid sensor histidine kinase/response regulator [Massilia sp. TS11]